MDLQQYLDILNGTDLECKLLCQPCYEREMAQGLRPTNCQHCYKPDVAGIITTTKEHNPQFIQYLCLTCLQKMYKKQKKLL